jgi:aminoglycoside-2''-adenylyltransferase
MGDALLGEQTRAHNDLDIAIRRRDQKAPLARLMAVLYGRRLNVQGDNKPINLTPIKIANYIYMGVAFSYSIYSLITQTGLCGYIEDAQFRWFDVAHTKLTILLAILILGAPAALIYTYIKRKESTLEPRMRQPTRPSFFMRRASWKSSLIMSPIPILIALLVYYAWVKKDRQDRQREIYKMDLSNAN